MVRRLPFAIPVLAWFALAAPPLTTIQDVIYKADGTRFNGTATVRWSSFEAIDRSNIANQQTTVRIVDGNLRVQLVPSTTSTPPIFYTVTYSSDGRVQFQETWAVPSSITPLRVRDVRTVANLTGADTSPTTVQQSNVVGLIADLGARPLKGPGFAAGRVAIVNTSGALESASGDSSDCVRVDGSAGPCGIGVGSSFIDGDVPAGVVDGSNTAFILASPPAPPSSLAIYRNGLLQKVGSDFSISDRTVQFVSAATPRPADTLLASYRVVGADPSIGGGSGVLTLDASQVVTGVLAAARLPAMGASGGGHQQGLVPDPGATAGATRFLREDGTWVLVTGGGGGGSVASVFGRAGVVAAQTGDYTASQVTNTVDQTATYANPSWLTSLAYAKITGVPSFEPAVTAGIASQYWRGDKTWQTLNAAAVANAVDQTATYANPSWLTSLAYAKITGVPSFEPAVTAGTASQYWRGDKTWQTLNAAAVTNAVDQTATYANPAWLTSLAWAKLTGVPATFTAAAHAASHQNGGADEVATAAPAANAIPKADATGKLAAGWLPSGTSTKILYYAPAAKNIGGVGASAFQCIANCPVATAIGTGSAAVASLRVTLGTSNQTSQDQFIVPAGYANQVVTAEVTFFSADSAHTGNFTLSVINVSTGAVANPTFAAVCSSVTLTPTASSGRVTATCTFTPSWTAGDEVFWKLAWTTTNLTSDLQVLAVRFNATF